MALLLQLSPSSSNPLLHFNFNFKPKSKSCHFIITTNLHPTLTLKPTSPIQSSASHTTPSPSNRLSPPLSSLGSIAPYVQSQWKPILAGWLCSAVSVYSLSLMVPKIGKFSAVMSAVDAVRLREEALLLGAMAMVRLVANYWQQAFLWDAALKAVFEIRVFVFERVLKRDLGFFEGGGGVSGGDIAYRITAEASDVADTIYALLDTIVPSILQLSAMATQMLVISPVLSLISALVIPLMAFVTAYLGDKLRKISKKANLSIAALSAYLNEVLPSILFVKANNAERSEGARFRWLADANLSEHLKKRKMKALIPQIVQIIYFGALLIFCVGSLMVFGGSFDCCGMVSFITSLVFLIEPIQGVGKAYNELKQGEPAIERLFDLTRFQSKVIEKLDAVNLDWVTGEVIFRDISFKYGEDMPLVLNGLDLHIKAGETVAFVGPSGGGKTTLMKLLLRLYDPLCGCILIDNHKIQNIRLESLRSHVGLVSQDTTLFSGTVAENIGYRDLMTKIDMERVKLAARTANADEFIELFPKHYETNIGPRGSSLSGGQKQRLAIARAVYQNSSILILDEATSALDSRSELLVRQAVQRLMENRTVLVIAHRLQTVLMAKRVFLLQDGKLKELKHSSLLDDHHDSLSASELVI
ncbi:ABC transporter B family member 29, chloroplastic isoform X1 [Camellia sinensis]|uniref:ABC transporter B family member 29, chloroplastic isoform X1 n=1 Tax=Camellia sinensis TaxID=4442 RepID=UPI001036C180|nr:ABC transporter B family member 29, chloroplastic isoform X1 [Camellia sinensis]